MYYKKHNVLQIKAGESTYSQSSNSNSRTVGGSVGTTGLNTNIGFSNADSYIDQTSYSNSQISAANGALNINTGNKNNANNVVAGKGDANIVGANLVAKDVNMNIAGNLLIKSKQNLLESDSSNLSMNYGTTSNGVNLGFSVGDGYQSRGWVDNTTTIIGTDSVVVNVGSKNVNNNYVEGTGNTNIVGAMIANKNSNGDDLGNLAINTGSLTFSNLHNYNNSDSTQFSASLQTGQDPNHPIIPGNLQLNLAMNGQENSSVTKATIGNGSININNTAIANDNIAIQGLNRDINNVETNKHNIITSDFDATLRIDLRLIAAAIAGGVGAFGVDKAKEVAKDAWGGYVGDVKGGVGVTVGYAINVSNDVKKKTSAYDAEGNIVKEGFYPLPIPGLFMSESKTGKGFYQGTKDNLWHEQMSAIADEASDPLINGDGLVKPSNLYYTDSQGNTYINQYDSNPALATLWHTVPVFKDFTKYHDASVDKGLIPSDQKASSIPSYLLETSIGAVGTLINPAFYQEQINKFKNSSSQDSNNNANQNNQ